MTKFETFLNKLAAGTLTSKEVMSSGISALERQSLLRAMALKAGGSAKTDAEILAAVESESGRDMSADGGKLDNAVANALDYGLVGDGVTDNTVQFQLMVEDLSHDRYFLPKGTYKISSAIVIKRGHILIEGEGRKGTTVSQTAADKNGFELQEYSAGQCNGVGFANLKIAGTGMATSTKTGIYLRPTSDLSNEFSSDHYIDNVQVTGFDRGVYAYMVPLLLMNKVDCINTNYGCVLENCDTPTLINCRFKGSDTGANIQTLSLYLKGTRAFSAQMINCEHGNTRRIADIEGGRLLWLGGNVENVTDDKAIEVDPGAALTIGNVRILGNNVASPSGSKTLIVANCNSSAANPEVNILNGNAFDIDATWQKFEARGSYAYNFSPSFLGSRPGTDYKIAGSTGPAGSTTTLKASNPFAIWGQKIWAGSLPNSSASSLARRGLVALFCKNDATEDSYNRFEHPVLFYKAKWGSGRRGSLLNDRLLDVRHADVTEYSTVGATRLKVVDHNFPSQLFAGDGESVTATLFGRFGATANTKRLEIEFAGDSVFDQSGAWSGKDWRMNVKVVRKAYNTVLVNTTLIIDGESPIVKFDTSTGHNFATQSRDFDIYATGVADDDIECLFSDAQWRKNSIED